MEAKVCCNVPCASWTTRKASGIVQSESRGLRCKGADVVTLILRLKLG